MRGPLQTSISRFAPTFGKSMLRMAGGFENGSLYSKSSIVVLSTLQKLERTMSDGHIAAIARITHRPSMSSTLAASLVAVSASSGTQNIGQMAAAA